MSLLKQPAQPLLLATDLDGTFLAGDADARKRLYHLVDAHPDVKLAWVTGRGREAILPLLADPGLPTPDYVICDVGATVLRTADMQPIQPLQSRIEARWPGEHVVAEAMRRFPMLVRQEVPQERRCSYYCHPEQLSTIQADVEADSLRVQKELIADNPHLYALLGPFSVDQELRTGRLQAAKVTMPDLKRYVTLAHPKQGQLTQASRIVSRLISETVTAWGGQITVPPQKP